MRRALAADESAPPVPAGVTVRPIRHDDEVELRAFHEVLETAFRDSMDHQSSTFEDFRARLTAMPRIDWDEWLVVESEGRIAGILQSGSTTDDEGWVRMLGVAKEFRGRGFGGLLLRSAFHLYAAKGYRSAGLGVDTANPTGAYRLYESVGMRPAYESDMYERTITAS
jgi:ribosomal protein S18 acetylase RimI-like enzyme